MTRKNKISSAQIVSKDVLEQLYKEADFFSTDNDNVSLSELLRSLNSETTPPMSMHESDPVDMVLNIRGTEVVNPQTGKTRVLPPIVGQIPSFASRTVTFPTTSGNDAVPSVGANLPIVISSGNFLKVGISVNFSGDVVLNAGDEAATQALATVPELVSQTIPVGYVVLENVAGTIQSISNDRIFQYVGGGSSSSDLFIDFNLENNQTTPADVDGFVIDSATNKAFSAELSISRIHEQILGEEDAAFYANLGTNFDGLPRVIQTQADGKILIGGDFVTFNSNTRNRLLRLNDDGTEDTAFYTSLGTGFSGGGASIDTIAIQSDGKILVGGTCNTFNSNTRNFLVRLNDDGTEDTAFYTNLGTGFNSGVSKVLLQSDGKILVGGNFTTFNTNTRNRLVRLNSDGTEDTAFYTNLGSGLNGSTLDAVQQSDGKIIIVGSFTTLNATTRNRMVRLNADGTVDTTFYTNLGTGYNAVVNGIALDSLENIYLSGEFTNDSRPYIAKVDSTGTKDLSFNPAPNFFASAIKVISGDKIAVVGLFSSINAQTTNRLTLLNSDGTTNTDFRTAANLAVGFSGNATRLGIDARGRLLIGGPFSDFNSNARIRLIRVNALSGLVELIRQSTLRGVYRTSSSNWEIGAETSIGDDTEVDFSITSGGQLQYTSSDLVLGLTESKLKASVKKL